MSLATLLLKLSNMKLKNKKDFSCVPSPSHRSKGGITIFIKASLLLKRSISFFRFALFSSPKSEKKKREKRKPEESSSRRAPKPLRICFLRHKLYKDFFQSLPREFLQCVDFFYKGTPSNVAKGKSLAKTIREGVRDSLEKEGVNGRLAEVKDPIREGSEKCSRSFMLKERESSRLLDFHAFQHTR